MSQTPRTDAAKALRDKACEEFTTERFCKALEDGDGLKKVLAAIPPDGWDIARTLERELNAANAELENAKKGFYGRLAAKACIEHDSLRTQLTELQKDDSPTWPYVIAFARRMEAKLEKNRHKGNREGWLKDHPWSLVERILDETVELQQCFTAIGAYTVNLTRTPEETADECADVANFCMMVADRVTYSAAIKSETP